MTSTSEDDPSPQPPTTSNMPHISELDDTAPTSSQPLSPSTEKTHQIRVKNRRKLYLDCHPSYFTNPDLELADPLLYDRCIRRFQTAAEREADGKAKGYSGVLEADLYRSEAKLAALAASTQPPAPSLSNLAISPSLPSQHGDEADDRPAIIPFVSYLRGPNREIMGEDGEEVKTREEGIERWKFEMTIRFLKGGDDDFEYGSVDENEEYDEVERREEEEKWFDDEEPSFDGEGDEWKKGETGVQDF